MDDILAFINKHKSDNQGTSSWLEETQYSIGGSSIGSFTGSSRTSIEDLVIDRVFKKRFENIYMDFGSLMEDVCVLYLELVLNTKVYGLGAVPYLVKDQKLMAHYSMDGLFRANMNPLCEFFPNEEQNYLLEIKFPYCRKIEKYKSNRVKPIGSCKIPSSYEDQIKMGLIVVSPAEMGVFCDCLARICRLDQMLELKSISPLFEDPRNEIKDCLATGIIMVFVNNEDLLDKDNVTYKSLTLGNQIVDGIVDFGTDFKNIIRALKEDKRGNNEFRLEYHLKLGLQDWSSQINKTPDLLGVIPYKLFDIYYGVVEKEEDFLEPYLERIEKVSSLLYESHGLSFDEKMLLLDGKNV